MDAERGRDTGDRGVGANADAGARWLCGKNAMRVRETSGIQVGCGQMREGAPMYLHALCTTWNE